MVQAFDTVYATALSLGFTSGGDEWEKLGSRPTCGYREYVESRNSWSIFLKAPMMRMHCFNKSRILRNCYASIVYDGNRDRFFLTTYTRDSFHPHAYSDGLLCIGGNSGMFDNYMKLDVALGLALCIKSFTILSPEGVTGNKPGLAYVCQSCKSKRKVNYLTYLPVKHPYRDGYLCRRCFARITREEQ